MAKDKPLSSLTLQAWKLISTQKVMHWFSLSKEKILGEGDLCILKHACVPGLCLFGLCRLTLRLFIIKKQNIRKMNRLKLDDDIVFETEGKISIGKFIKVEKGAVYNDGGTVKQNVFPDVSSVTSEMEDIMSNSKKTSSNVIPSQENTIELCHFIHPSVTDENEKLQIHLEIKNLVATYTAQDICSYLSKMADSGKILLPLSLELAMKELHRMGMPDENTNGFNKKTFYKYYKK